MIKLLTEISPLIAFFFGFKQGGIHYGTLYMLVVAVIAAGVSYLIHRKIQVTSMVSLVLIIITASITLISGNVKFIKMKPTILYLAFALSLIISSMRNKPLLKYLMQEAIQLDEKAWKQLGLRFGGFFLTMAVANEIIWRNYEDALWVKFKVFGATPLILLFVIFQIPYLLKHQKPKTSA